MKSFIENNLSILEVQFILQNLHFAISLFVALVFFAIAWLYFDAWVERKTLREVPKFLGFFLLCLSFIAYAPVVELAILSEPILGPGTLSFATSVLRLIGYALLVFGLFLDPIQPKPQHDTEEVEQVAAVGFFGKATGFSLVVLPFFALTVATLYLRRATIGLERHLKRVALGFFVLALAEGLHIAAVFRDSQNVIVYDLVASFGPLWIFEHILLILTSVILWSWVFRYLLKRLQTQFFLIFISLTLGLFLVTTLIFSGLLFSSLKGDAERNLKTSVKVLNFAIESKKSEALSDAQLISQNPQVVSNTKSKSRIALQNLTSEIIASKNQSNLLIVSPAGEVLARPDAPERVGESISEDALFKKAIESQAFSTVVPENGVLSQQMSIRAASPILDGEEIVGVVITGTTIDDAFVDGIKSATDLDSSVYSGLEMTATTFISPDGKTRYTGSNQDEARLILTIFTYGETYLGELEILTTPYLVAVSPLKDIDNNSVGMLLIGKEKTDVLQTISKAIEMTFLLSVVLLIVSIFPIYLIARYITNQFRQ